MELKEEIEKHNKYAEEEFKKAEKGEQICLTDLMISKERILEKMDNIGRVRYRARGVYMPTGKESWITALWRDTEKEAKEDIECFGHNYKNTKIIKE